MAERGALGVTGDVCAEKSQPESGARLLQVLPGGEVGCRRLGPCAAVAFIRAADVQLEKPFPRSRRSCVRTHRHFCKLVFWASRTSYGGSE